MIDIIETLQNQNEELIASVLFSTILKVLQNKDIPHTKQHLANEIGKSLLNALKLKKIDFNDLGIIDLNLVEMQLGLNLLEMALNRIKDILISYNEFNKDRRETIIAINPSYINVLAKTAFNPILLPMISSPKIWQGKTEAPTDGGYYS